MQSVEKLRVVLLKPGRDQTPDTYNRGKHPFRLMVGVRLATGINLGKSTGLSWTL